MRKYVRWTVAIVVTVTLPVLLVLPRSQAKRLQLNRWEENSVTAAMAQIAAAGTTITAESCVTADNAISPGETVTIDFGLINNGSSATTDLVANLQPTGGITGPSGGQDYGVIPADSSTVVSRSFTFTADTNVNCGDTITATFDLQDNSTALGTVAFNLVVGIPGSSNSFTRGTGTIATAIPDNGSVDIPINVSQMGTVTDVNVKLRLNHTFDGDLRIRLLHPDGTEVMLSNRRGGGGDNFGTGANDCAGVSTVFDDSADTAIASGAAPFAGSFRPDSSLSTLNGKNTNGTWILRISDDAPVDTGSVGCVQLQITRERYVCCGIEGTPEMEALSGSITQESCPLFNGSIDPDELVTVQLPLRNIGDGATTDLVATLLPSGGVMPVTLSENYGVVGPLDSEPTSRPFTFIANGSCGGTITATLQLNDGFVDLGTVDYSFRLGSTASSSTTFSNPTPILVPSGQPLNTTGVASPYPSNINVTGIVNPVSKVAVKLINVNHTFPDDMDILLVGPGGQEFIIMSDAGGGADLINTTITLDDDADSLLPDSTLIASGSFKPANYGAGDLFAVPAPGSPYETASPAGEASFASVFGGLDPNGTWRLYVVDDTGGDVGNINGGWELIITTAEHVCCESLCIIACPTDISVSNDSGQCGAIVNYTQASAEGTCGELAYSIPSGSFFPVGTTVVTVTGASGATCSFNVTVNDSDAPVITRLSATPSVLWPPNHKMQDVSVYYNASDSCAGGVVCSIVSIASNEPVYGLWDGDMGPDWEIVDGNKVRLRAERAGDNSGRVYTITVECADENGNKSTRTVTVTVPRNR